MRLLAMLVLVSLPSGAWAQGQPLRKGIRVEAGFSDNHEGHDRSAGLAIRGFGMRTLPFSSAVFVAVEGPEVIGVAAVRAADSAPGAFTAELDALYVLPLGQHQGIGTRLFLATAQWLADRGHHGLVLWVLRDNPYRRFYLKCGGELVDEREQTFGDQAVQVMAYGWSDLPAPPCNIVGDVAVDLGRLQRMLNLTQPALSG